MIGGWWWRDLSGSVFQTKLLFSFGRHDIQPSFLSKDAVIL